MHFGGTLCSMVNYGQTLLFITDKPVAQSVFGFNSPYLLNNPSRRKIFNDYKESWFAVMKWHGNDDTDDEEFYEVHKEILSLWPYWIPENEINYNVTMKRLSQELINSFGADYVYEMDGGNFNLYYETPYEHNDKFNYGGLMEECSKELFAWIFEFMRDRIDGGSKVNKLVYCYGGNIENLNKGYITFNLDLDSIEIPNDNTGFFHKEAMKVGVDLSESENGFIANFYKSSNK